MNDSLKKKRGEDEDEEEDEKERKGCKTDDQIKDWICHCMNSKNNNKRKEME